MFQLIQSLESYKTAHPQMGRAVDNMLRDLRRLPSYPYGLSYKLVESLNAEISPNPEACMCDAILNHRSITRPELHHETPSHEDKLRRVVSFTSWMRWHLSPGSITSKSNYYVLKEQTVKEAMNHRTFNLSVEQSEQRGPQLLRDEYDLTDALCFLFTTSNETMAAPMPLAV